MPKSSSITTKRGDAGRTSFLFGETADKSHPRLAAVGDIDELNAALGVVRLYVKDPEVAGIVPRAQADLVAIMGMLSAGPENAERYATAGFQRITAEHTARLTAEAASLESRFPEGFHHWSTPGASGSAGEAWLEMARGICRRAERAVVALPPDDLSVNPDIIPWLNRLSDLLWLAARVEEEGMKKNDA